MTPTPKWRSLGKRVAKLKDGESIVLKREGDQKQTDLEVGKAERNRSRLSPFLYFLTYFFMSFGPTSAPYTFP
jgi:hypothetical protein